MRNPRSVTSRVVLLALLAQLLLLACPGLAVAGSGEACCGMAAPSSGSPCCCSAERDQGRTPVVLPMPPLLTGPLDASQAIAPPPPAARSAFDARTHAPASASAPLGFHLRAPPALLPPRV